MGFFHNRNPYSMLQFFMLICSCFPGFTSAVGDTIRVNKSIRDPENLVSSGQKFRLGFFSPGNSSPRFVGIMYNLPLPVMTVIWVANREKPLNDSTGTVEISGDGNLVILDGQKEIIWSTNLSNPVANSSALLMDTGNLVLQDKNRTTIWESFQHPSDSFIKNMTFNIDKITKEKNILTSWRSPFDPGPGSFTHTIERPDVPECFVWKNGYPYWRSGPWNRQIFIGIRGMRSFYNKQGLEVVGNHVTFTDSLDLLHYFWLNSSGVFLERLWSDEKGDWEVKWSSIENECDIYGTCGPFGICNSLDRLICKCFPGFEPKNIAEWNAANWTSGCKRKTPLFCEDNSVEEMGKYDGFQKLQRVKLPDNFKYSPHTEEECKTRCLNNCSCIAYAYYEGIGCMQWAESLIDVQQFTSGTGNLFLRLPFSELNNTSLGHKKDPKMIIVTTVILGIIIIPLCSYILWLMFLKCRGGRKQKGRLLWPRSGESLKTDTWYSKESMLKSLHGVQLEELPLFKFEILSNATDDFNSINKLGQGGFGPVYKGKLPDGQEIAVKKLARTSNQGLEEFMNEVEVISKLQHRNLVRLLGCCVECEQTMLVYEYMPNGSLDAYLFGSHKKDVLDWKNRAIIIEGICRGLLYLHRDSRLRIIHRDLKASNILLDEELNPKISDFGMARIFGGKEDQANTTRVVGTYGYMAPEYALQGLFSEKSDVYSFGVLLLEILSGRRNTSSCNEEQALFLTAHAWTLWNEEKIISLMDPVIYDPEMEPDIRRYANVGLLCVQEIASDRPHISTVLSMLSCKIVELPRPKQPAFVVQGLSETEGRQKYPSKCSSNYVTVTTLEGR